MNIPHPSWLMGAGIQGAKNRSPGMSTNGVVDVLMLADPAESHSPTEMVRLWHLGNTRLRLTEQFYCCPYASASCFECFTHDVYFVISKGILCYVHTAGHNLLSHNRLRDRSQRW